MLSSQAIWRYGMSTEFSQVTKPKMKKSEPMIIIERVVPLFVVSAGLRVVLFVIILH